MKIKRIVFGFLILSLLACNFVTQIIAPPTATPTLTATATASPTLTPTPLVPAYIPPECVSVPLATISPDLAVQATPEFAIPDVSQKEQVEILHEIENIIEDTYVYPDYNGKDWNGIKSRYQAKIKTGLDTQSFYNEMHAMITELGDEHSFFMSPRDVAEWDAEQKGQLQYVGIGVEAQMDYDRGRIVIISTFPGSPAEHAGLQQHDTILLVDGKPLTKELGNRLRGPQCSAVVLTVQSPGEAPRDVLLLRHAIEGSAPVDARLVNTTDGAKVGYIFIPSFFDETIPEQVKNALDHFGPLDGLILDLRMNGGGSNSVTFPILEYFVQGRLGKFVSRRSSETLDIRPNEIQNSQSVPLIVLVSQDTVSFAEIFAGVLRDAKRAQIVGETSSGNVEIMRGHDFEDGSQLWLAAETFHSAFSDTNWEETGIVPDVQAFAEWDTFYFETDPSVAAALQLLGHQ